MRLIAMTVFALSASMIGMPKIGLVLSCRAAGFTTSLAPTTIATSVCGISGLMSSISTSAVVGDLRLGEQHVHVAGHAAGHRVNRELHVDAALGELVVELAHAMLRLRDRHAVAGDDHDAARVLEDVGHVLRRRALDRLRLGGRRTCATWPNAPNSTLVNERFIALHMMTDRMKPDDPSSAPAMMSSLFSSTKPIATAESPAYEFSSEMTVGMSAPPIGHDQQHAEQQRQHDDDREQLPGLRLDDEVDAREPTAMASSARLTRFWFDR